MSNNQLLEALNKWVDTYLSPNGVKLQVGMDRRFVRINSVIAKETRFNEVVNIVSTSWNKEETYFDLSKILGDITDKNKVGDCWEIVSIGENVSSLVLEVKKLAV